MKYHFFKSKYYKKILFMLLIISIIPVIVLSLSVKRILEMEKETTRSMQESSITNIRNEIESMFKNLEYSINRSILKSTFIQSLDLPRESKKFQEFNKISEELKLLQSPELQLADIILVSNTNNWIMSMDEFTTLDLSNSNKLVKDFMNMKKSAFWYDEKDAIYFVKQIPINVTTGKGMLIIKINKSTLFDKIHKNDLGYSIIITDADNSKILGDEKDNAILTYTNSVSDKKNQLFHGEVVEVVFEDESYALAMSESDYNDWRYTSIITTSYVNREYLLIKRMLVISVIGAVLFGITCSIIYSNKLYSPINEINEIVDMNVLSSEKASSEQKNITKKLRYLLSDNAQMRKIISSQAQSEQKKFLTNLYLGEIIDIDRGMFTNYDLIKETENHITMYVIGVKFCEQIEDRKERKLFLFALGNIIEELLTTEDIFPPIEIGDILYVTYLHKTVSNEGIELKLKKNCEMMIEASNQYLNRQINVGVSMEFDDLNEFPNAFNQSNQMLRRTMNQLESCIFYGKYKESSHKPVEFKLKQKRMLLLNAVIATDEREALIKLDEYFQNLLELDYYLLKLEINKLLTDIMEYCNDYFVALDYTKIKEIVEFDIGSSLDSVDVLKNHIWLHFLMPLFQQIEQPEDEANISTQLINYINNNIESDLSLDECAMKFNYNPNYLSRMFKKNFNKTFTEYVTEKKLERCKDMLLTTDISVNEIAFLMGYNSSQNFIRVFKKYMLMTPGQFRLVNKVQNNIS